MSEKHPYIGFLEIGDVLETKSRDGKRITIKFTKVAIDPTWEGNGGLLLYFDHEVEGQEPQEAYVTLSNLQQWFKDAVWTRVEQK